MGGRSSFVDVTGERQHIKYSPTGYQTKGFDYQPGRRETEKDRKQMDPVAEQIARRLRGLD